MRKVLIEYRALGNVSELNALALLQDIQEGALLQVGPRLIADMIAAFASPSRRERARAAFDRLRERKRLLFCEDIAESAVCQWFCDQEHSVCEFHIVGDDCVQRPDSIRLCRYIESTRRAELCRRDLSFIEWTTRAEWERRILIPLFRYARQLAVVDYHIGRNVREFEPTLIWLDALYQQYASPRHTPLKIYTSAISAAERRASTQQLRAYDWDVHIRRYSGNLRHSMPHDRYLITDRAALSIGRGMNLSDGVATDVRDSAIFVVEDSAAVLNKCYRAPDVS